MRKLNILIAITSLLSFNPAFAQSNSPTDWSGTYIGGFASFDGGDIQAVISGVPDPIVDLDDQTSFGGFIGFNKQVDAFVFGGELAVTSGGLQAFAGENYQAIFDLKSHAGYSFENVLAYGVVGGSFANYTDTTGTFNIPSGGSLYGVGVKVMLNNGVFVGAEYLVRDISGTELLIPAIEALGNIQSLELRAGWTF